MPSAIPSSPFITTAQEDFSILIDSNNPAEPLLPIAPITTTKAGTVLYLAYGSNLSKATFRGQRGINPLSSKVVHVPSLTLTFDLPGVPYSEPCFANSRHRDPSAIPPKSPYHKDRWQKGMIGVVYEVTIDDYRKIIASEGAGIGYKDVMVDCFLLPPGVESLEVGLEKNGESFKAHTLLAPPADSKSGVHRSDKSYAQPSARYLNLITTGAEEHSLPADYMDYLNGIRPYTITTMKQRIALWSFAALWFMALMLLFALGRRVADKNGHMPKWLGKLMTGVFVTLWTIYDYGLKRIFGEGERTIGDD